MQDGVVAQPAENVAAQQEAFKAELNRQMQMSGIVPPTQQPETPAQPAPDVPRETPPVAQPDTPPASDFFTPFKEKYGFQTHEEALAEIEAYRQMKSQPFKEVPFANEDSAAIAMALSEGKFDDVREFLNKQHRLGSLSTMEVTADSAADIVKYGLAIKHPYLNESEINYEFNRQFATPPKPAQFADEDQPEYEARVAQWQQSVNDRQMALMIEAKKFRPELENAKKTLAFPKIQQPVDDGYAQYQKMLEDQQKQDAETVAAYKTFTPQQFETALDFTDEANKISFKFQYQPDQESFNKAVQIASDWTSFTQHYTNSDGTPNRQKFLQDMLFALNRETYLSQAMNQAKNAAIKAQLPDNSASNGLQRQVVPLQPGEEDPIAIGMRRAGIVRAAN